MREKGETVSTNLTDQALEITHREDEEVHEKSIPTNLLQHEKHPFESSNSCE